MRTSHRRARVRRAFVPSALVVSIGVAAACLMQGGAHASTLVEPVSVPSTPAVATPTAPAVAVPTLPTTTAGTADPLDDIVLEQSGFTVYPVRDGYLDSVAFVASAVDATGTEIPVSGTATLSHDGTPVTVWSVTEGHTVLD